jgi:glycosyltransferase involved in cell wall biosynthesis
MKTAVLIPCYNEEATIGKVVRDFRAALPDADIYVYNNNSTDHTAQVAEEAGAIVRQERCQGKGHVIRRMFREVDADIYLMTDGDDTYPAGQAPLLVQAVAERQVDMAVGDRLSSTYFTENKRPFHNSGNRMVRSLIRRFWHSDIHDIMTGYRAFSRRFVKLFPVMTGNFEIETEMTIHALDKRFAIEEIAIQYQDRPEGSVSKLNTFSDGRKVLSTIFNLFKEYRPLHFFTWTALIIALVAVILLVPVFTEYLRSGLVPRFPTLIAGLGLLLVALMCYFTGLCLDVMGAKDRKQYELRVIEFEERHPGIQEK